MTLPAPRLTKETDPFIAYVPDAQVVKRLGPGGYFAGEPVDI